MLVDQCYAQALYQWHCCNILAHLFLFHQYAELVSVPSQSAMLLSPNSLLARMLKLCTGVQVSGLALLKLGGYCYTEALCLTHLWCTPMTSPMQVCALGTPYTRQRPVSNMLQQLRNLRSLTANVNSRPITRRGHVWSSITG